MEVYYVLRPMHLNVYHHPAADPLFPSSQYLAVTSCICTIINAPINIVAMRGGSG